MPERITLTTADDVVIVGDWVPATRVIGAAVLLHMMSETRGSWAPVQEALAKRNIASLAIDLRGHGESMQTIDGETVDYQKFSDDDHQTSILDAAAAVAWVRTRGVDLNRIALAGASIGANLALLELTEEPHLTGAVLLSPGSDYRGFRALEDAQNMIPEQRLVIVSSEDDAESFGSSKTLYDQAPVEIKTFVPYKNAGHGTAMFKADPALPEKIAEWIAEMIHG